MAEKETNPDEVARLIRLSIDQHINPRYRVAVGALLDAGFTPLQIVGFITTEGRK